MMNTKGLLFFIAAIASSPLLAGPTLDVKNSEGRALMIELIALDGETVTFSTVGEKAKEHSLPLAKFDEASQEKLREEAKTLPPRLPKIDIEVSISNKRDKDGYYMVTQAVSSKVKIRNLTTNINFPKAKGHVVYFGQNRRSPGVFKLMGKQSFDFTIPASKTFETDVLGFKTRYDSDNKGYGNIGGYQYESYILVITDEEGNVIATKTTDGSIRTAVDKDKSKAKALVDLPENAMLNKNLESMDNNAVE